MTGMRPAWRGREAQRPCHRLLRRPPSPWPWPPLFLMATGSDVSPVRICFQRAAWKATFSGAVPPSAYLRAATEASTLQHAFVDAAVDAVIDELEILDGEAFEADAALFGGAPPAAR